MKKEDIEKYSVTATGLNESDMGAKEALGAGYITQTGFAEGITSASTGDTEDHVGGSETNPTPVIPAPGSEDHSAEGHSETNPTPASSDAAGSHVSGLNQGGRAVGSEGHTTSSETDSPTNTTIGGTQFPNDKSVFVANASAASSIIDALTAKDLDSLVSLYKLDQESSWPSATDWKKMNVPTKRSTVKSALGFA